MFSKWLGFKVDTLIHKDLLDCLEEGDQVS